MIIQTMTYQDLLDAANENRIKAIDPNSIEITQEQAREIIKAWQYHRSEALPKRQKQIDRHIKNYIWPLVK